jgi:hypothetical protein
MRSAYRFRAVDNLASVSYAVAWSVREHGRFTTESDRGLRPSASVGGGNVSIACMMYNAHDIAAQLFGYL